MIRRGSPLVWVFLIIKDENWERLEGSIDSWPRLNGPKLLSLWTSNDNGQKFSKKGTTKSGQSKRKSPVPTCPLLLDVPISFLPSLMSHLPFRSLRNHNAPNGPSMQYPVPHALSRREKSRELMGVLGRSGHLGASTSSDMSRCGRVQFVYYKITSQTGIQTHININQESKILASTMNCPFGAQPRLELALLAPPSHPCG